MYNYPPTITRLKVLFRRSYFIFLEMGILLQHTKVPNLSLGLKGWRVETPKPFEYRKKGKKEGKDTGIKEGTYERPEDDVRSLDRITFLSHINVMSGTGDGNSSNFKLLPLSRTLLVTVVSCIYGSIPVLVSPDTLSSPLMGGLKLPSLFLPKDFLCWKSDFGLTT